MRRALKDRLASYKIPQEMKVLDAIPRNAMGKGKYWILLLSCLLLISYPSQQEGTHQGGL